MPQRETLQRGWSGGRREEGEFGVGGSERGKEGGEREEHGKEVGGEGGEY